MRAVYLAAPLLAGLLCCGREPSPCFPATCESLGKNCGQVSDLCGGILECGTCPEGQRCGRPGLENVCNPPACTRVNCASLGKDCGVMPDGCGELLYCGECLQPWPPQAVTAREQPYVCGGARIPNVCGIYPCIPKSCTVQGKNCGVISDECAGVLRCGVCTWPQTCGGGGVQNVCG